VAFFSSAAGTARIAFSDSACRLAATLAPFFSPSASDGGATTGPLSPISRANRPLANGDVIRTLMSRDPATRRKWLRSAIAPEFRDVLVYPFERRHLIHQAVIARGVMRGFRRQLGVRKETENAEAIICADEHDAAQRQLLPVEIPSLDDPAKFPPP